MKKLLPFLVIGLVALILFVIYPYYNRLYKPIVRVADGKYELFIKTGTDYSQVAKQLFQDGVVRDAKSFHWVSEQMNYQNNVKAGRYVIEDGMSTRDLVTLLRSGKQSPIRYTFVKFRTIEELAEHAAEKFEFSQRELLFLLENEEYLKQFNVNANSVLSIFVPNTYEIYWNVTPEAFVARMHKEYRTFWTQERVEKTWKWHLTKLEVISIASIVEEETNKDDEKSKIAGVYFNRIREGWKLEADPTVKFALKNFALKRILQSHLSVESPFNTYLNKGIPPGPICTPSPTTIDAVLDGERHEYMFFCAKSDLSGYHHFSKTLEQHLSYAGAYHLTLDSLQITQ